MTDGQDPLTLACLVPEGRAARNAEVTFAHANGRYLAGRGARLVADGVEGEIAAALVAGAAHAGGQVRIAVPFGESPPTYPAPVQVIELKSAEHPPTWIGAHVDAVWALPPRVADLERYFEVWTAAVRRPVLCVAEAGEFRLLRGIVEEIAPPGSRRRAHRLLFASSPEEGWTLLSETLRARPRRRVRALGIGALAGRGGRPNR
jgi:hypothetical protein